MIRIPLELNSRTHWLSPYNSKKEKDILIMSSFEVQDIDKYLELLEIDIDDLTLDEKKVILWKSREISLGNEVNIKYTCDNPDCKQVVESTLSASDFVVKGTRSDDKIKKLNIDVNDDTLYLFLDKTQDELDELPIDQYENLLQVVKDNQDSYDFIRSSTCLSCRAIKKFDMSSVEYIIDSLSDENLASIYRVYSHLIYHGNYSKEDIDSMYPFERTIFVGLLHSIKAEK